MHTWRPRSHGHAGCGRELVDIYAAGDEVGPCGRPADWSRVSPDVDRADHSSDVSCGRRVLSLEVETRPAGRIRSFREAESAEGVVAANAPVVSGNETVNSNASRRLPIQENTEAAIAF